MMSGSFRRYYCLLRRFQYLLLVMEMLICLARLFTQTLFALSSALTIIQPLLVVFMMSK